jgi:hypothetical protein
MLLHHILLSIPSRRGKIFSETGDYQYFSPVFTGGKIFLIS